MLYKRLPHVALQEVGFEDDVMVYDVKRGILHIINSTAAAILSALEEPKTVQEMTTYLLEHYDIDRDTALEEISSILKEFEQQELIEHVYSTDATVH